MNDQNQESTQVKRKNPYAVWFVVLSFVAPVALAYIMFYFVDVTSFTNRGEIFKPMIRVEALELKDKTGQIIPKDKLTYKWRVFSFVGASCNDACQKRLIETRQMHIALGKDQHRILRVIVHMETASAELDTFITQEFPRALRMYADENKLMSVIQNNAQLRNNEIYYMDPYGNIMMRFTQDQPIKDAKYDLRKLLKASQIG